MLTLPRAIAHLSRVIRLPPSSMWHECNEPELNAMSLLFSLTLKMMFGRNLNTHIVLKLLAKSLIRLCVCAGRSEPLLVAHTTLLLVCTVCDGSNLGFNPLIPITPYRVL